jgi:hypothetical protein
MVNPGVHPKPTRFGEFVLLVMRRHANREIVQVNLKPQVRLPGAGWSSVTTGPAAVAVSSAGPPRRLLGLTLITAGAAASRRSDERS